MLRLAFVLAVTLTAATTALGHDFWLEPSTFQPAAGTPVAIRLMVGDHFDGEPVGRHDSRIETFLILDAKGRRDVAGRQGADPAGTINAAGGGGIVGYRSRPLRHGTMSVKRFEQYLREEGLDHIIDRRRSTGASSKPGREIYSRSAKAFLGGSEDKGFDVPLGFRLEIIPETNPAAAGSLVARVAFEGRPVSGVRVTAISRGNAAAPISARSDEGGRVVLPLDRGGVWLVKAVHMIDAPEGRGVDWESIWASLVFERSQ